jgi:hypothetical protein
LNHVSDSRIGIAGVYRRHNGAKEKREVLNAWTERAAAIVAGRASSCNVIPLRA